jgi:hypothetical protein
MGAAWRPPLSSRTVRLSGGCRAAFPAAPYRSSTRAQHARRAHAGAHTHSFLGLAHTRTFPHPTHPNPRLLQAAAVAAVPLHPAHEPRQRGALQRRAVAGLRQGQQGAAAAPNSLPNTHTHAHSRAHTHTHTHTHSRTLEHTHTHMHIRKRSKRQCLSVCRAGNGARASRPPRARARARASGPGARRGALLTAPSSWTPRPPPPPLPPPPNPKRRKHTTHTAPQAFTEKVVEECATDADFVWIHDYHLLVLPSLLRKRFNKIRCGWVVRVRVLRVGTPFCLLSEKRRRIC